MERYQRKAVKRILFLILIWLRLITPLDLIRSMGQTVLSSTFMRTQQDQLFNQSLKGIMLPFWHTDKQGRGRPSQWRASSIFRVILREVLYPEQWRKSSDTLSTGLTNIQHLWSEQATFRFIMKQSLIF